MSRRALTEVLGWSVVVWVVVFWRLGYLSLLDPDEAHYAQLTREMVQAHQWMVPLLQGVPFVDKPVLYHWLQMAAEALFGEREFALRLPSACAAVAMFWTVWWAGKSLFDAHVGRWSALMFATTPLTFALASIGVFDMVYTAFLFGAMASLLVSARNARPAVEWVGWTLLALAVMVKGPVAVLLVMLFGLLLFLGPTTRPLVRALRWPWGLLWVALIASPWFVYMAVNYPDRFVREYLLAGNLWYFTRPAAFSNRQSDVLFYARTYLGACFPWSVLALGFAVDARRTGTRHSPVARALWIWTLLIIGFFSIAGFKLDTYIYPAAPTTTLLVALALREQRDATPLRGLNLAASLCAAVLVIGGLVLGVTMFRIDLGLTLTAAILPVALVLGGSVALLQMRRAGVAALANAFIVTLLVAYSAVVVEGFPVLERSRPTAPIGRWVDRHAPSDLPVGMYGLDDWRASIRFYSRRPLAILHDEAEVISFYQQYPGGYVLMLRRDAKAFREHGVPLDAIGGRRAIVGRSGKFIRRQLWGRIVVTRREDPLQRAELQEERDLPDE